jgi:putative glutathione S-transferase
MGQLIEGVWHADAPAEVPGNTSIRNWITADGKPGPTGRGGFRAEPGRYHLYVSYACPWAHRTLIYRALKRLDGMIGVSVVHWLMGADGWTFVPDEEGLVGDRLNRHELLRQIYQASEPGHTGRVTVPVLWDTTTKRIVSNESADIIRMLNSAFDGIGAAAGDYYPPGLRDDIEALNARIFADVNKGVYKAGFARTQADYEGAVTALFDTLDELDSRLAERRFLLGDTPTEADWRLLPTLLRFDLVYHGHFKCNVRRLVDYRNLSGYARELYQWPGIAATCNFDHVKRHYYQSHRHINPTGIVPLGPSIDYAAPHDRGRVFTRGTP